MDIAIRAKRDSLAMDAIVAAADVLGDRFGVPFDAAAARRHDPDPFVRALFLRETVAGFLQALAEVTAPAQSLPSASDRMGAMTVAELRGVIEASGAADLDTLEAAERDGENRKGVLTAIERRRDVLAAEEPGDSGEDESAEGDEGIAESNPFADLTAAGIEASAEETRRLAEQERDVNNAAAEHGVE